MPIEIKELHIRVAVNTPQNGKPTGIGKASSSSNQATDEMKEIIVAECVEQILQIIQNKAER